KGGHAARFLSFGNHLQGHGGLAARLRAEDLHYTATGKSAYAQGCVKGNGAGGNHGDGNNGFLAPQPHNGTFAELLFNLRQGKIDCPGPFPSVFSHLSLQNVSERYAFLVHSDCPIINIPHLRTKPQKTPGREAREVSQTSGEKFTST